MIDWMAEPKVSIVGELERTQRQLAESQKLLRETQERRDSLASRGVETQRDSDLRKNAYNDLKGAYQLMKGAADQYKAERDCAQAKLDFAISSIKCSGSGDLCRIRPDHECNGCKALAKLNGWRTAGTGLRALPGLRAVLARADVKARRRAAAHVRRRQ